MEKPKRIDLTPEELDALVERVEADELQPGDSEIIRAMAETIAYLSQVVDEKGVSIRRLLRALFGSSSEKLEKILPPPEETQPDPSGGGSALDTEESRSDDDSERTEKPRRGHGRNSAEKYRGAERIDIPHPELRSGDSCPRSYCTGKVYKLRVPKLVVRVRGQAPLQPTVVGLERLRCNLCLEIFTAPAPAETGEEKYDATSASMIALLKYGSGLPFNRIEKLEGNLGIPLPASTQWDIVNAAAMKIAPAHQELIRQAAAGEILHNDDTGAKILDRMGKRRDKAVAAGALKETDRSGLFTSGIVSVDGDHRIALFFTGAKHAGENLTTVLSHRSPVLEAPIQMCDALSRNTSAEFRTMIANCLSHGRRQFVDVAENFPEECRRVLEALGEVYRFDAEAKEAGLTPPERLRFHREHSRPVMVELRLWFREVFRDKEVEPNSSLGKAISYMKKHWLKLTLFYRRAGAPLDNNLCERALKKAILHRKNALFFRSERGAQVGDLFLSLIHTAELAGENPFEYLTALQCHSAALAKAPREWLPWNYRETLAAIASGSPSTPPSS